MQHLTFLLDFENFGPGVLRALKCFSHMEVGIPLADASDRMLPGTLLNLWPFRRVLLGHVMVRDL